MHKKLVPISLMFILLIPSWLICCWLQYEKWTVQREVKKNLIRGIDRDELVLLKFTQSETEAQLEWEHSKEFEFNGRMYDVVEMQTFGDSVYYWCWWDHEETKLNRQLTELTKNALGQDSQRRENTDQLHSLLRQLYYAPCEEWLSISPAESKNCCFYSFICSNWSIPPPTHPPQIA